MKKRMVGKLFMLVPFGIAWFCQPLLVSASSRQLSPLIDRLVSHAAEWSESQEHFDPFLAEARAVDANPVANEAFEVDGDLAMDGRSVACVTSGVAAKTGANKAKKPRPLPQEPSSVHVSQATVLRLAQAGLRPTGKPVLATAYRPSGIQVFGASSLGIGVRDGDVLTHVSGTPVSSVGQVVALILSARAAHQSVISGKLWRGNRSYAIAVEQPYPSRNGASVDSEVSF